MARVVDAYEHGNHRPTGILNMLLRTDKQQAGAGIH